MLAIATDFHYVRLLRLFAILATVFAVLFWRAIAGRVGALIFLFVCHRNSPAVGLGLNTPDPKTRQACGQGRTKPITVLRAK